MELKIKKLDETAKIISKATEDSVGYDLYACLKNKVIIKPGKTVKIGTGLSIEISEKNIGGFIFARSGMATNHGIIPVNCVGVIDNDYRGEIIVALKNTSCLDYEIINEDRIAQIVFLPVINFDNILISNNLSDSDRGSGGFGSTGKN
ncbi:MAG: dUTP diphosphatase [Oscillospiraceae bacterium]|nr:dUTP diphosphatase [Oscillospiraceae bacterium]